MKKQLSAFLALILALSLSVPAMAAAVSPDYNFAPEVQAWIDAHPDEVAGFLDNIDAYIQEEWRWFDSLADMAAAWDEDESAAAAYLLDQWASRQQEEEAWQTWLSGYEARNPGVQEKLRANAYDYFAETFPYDSVEMIMESYELTEEGFLDWMVESQLYDIYYAELTQKAIDEAKAAMGGVPGQLGVMLNGSYITFSDAVPEASNGRIMVPFRALMEAMGGDVSYDSSNVYCILDGTTLTLTPGSAVMTIQREGSTAQLTMDCAPYVRDGRTYVPVRFVSEAFGFCVGWDGNYQSAVILDPAAAADAIDADFSILNRALAGRLPTLAEGQSYQDNIQGSMTYTAFDTLAGSTVYQATLSAQSLRSGSAISGSATASLSGSLVELLLKDADLSAEEAAQLYTALRQIGLDYILTSEGAFWLRSPLTALMDQGDAGTWYGYYLGQDAAQFLLQAQGPATVGSLITSSAADCSTVTLWADLMDAGRELAAEAGDGRFTHSASSDTLSLTLAGLLGSDPSLEYQFKELELNLTVDSAGNLSFSLTMETLPQYYGDNGTRITVDYTRSGGTAHLSLNYHEANTGMLSLSLTSTTQVTSQSPMTQPPEGSPVVIGPYPNG